MNRSTTIFIKSCAKDAQWLFYCLRSLEKFAIGFDEVVIVMGKTPKSSRLNRETQWMFLPEPDISGDGYMAQQVIKLNADKYCSGDLIFFVDSDCFLPSEQRPQDYLSADGKPLVRFREWQDAETAIKWREPTRKALGFDPQFEMMCGLPLIVPREILPALRFYMETLHGVSIEDYVMSCQGWNFSEFNVIYNFAMRASSESIEWVLNGSSHDTFPRSLIQRWSWSPEGVSPFIEEYGRLLG